VRYVDKPCKGEGKQRTKVRLKPKDKQEKIT
jgi:hypothetical protein